MGKHISHLIGDFWMIILLSSHANKKENITTEQVRINALLPFDQAKGNGLWSERFIGFRLPQALCLLWEGNSLADYLKQSNQKI